MIFVVHRVSKRIRVHYSSIISVLTRSRLRSADNDDMIVTRTRTARYGPRSFRVAALQFGACYYLISRTVMLVANSSSRALRRGFFCKPTHKRRLWELFQRHFTNTRFDWL